MGRVERLRSLPRSFYARDTLVVARELLGKVVVVRSAKGLAAGRIVETEAYRADDPASHSCRGPTPRSEIMFGPPGVAYVYFIYGTYEMLNFVTEPRGSAGAVLIRALEPVFGQELMARRRGLPLAGRLAKSQALASGPGKLCRALGIGREHNGLGLGGPEIRVCRASDDAGPISVSPRVGIRVGVDSPWRFFLTGNPHVSRCPQNKMAKPAGRAGL